MLKRVLLTSTIFLLAAGFLLVWDSPPEMFLPKSRAIQAERPEADTYMIGTRATQYDAESGAVKLLVQTRRTDQFPDGGEVLMEAPIIDALMPDGRQLHLTAERGHLSASQDLLTLLGNVEVSQQRAGEIRVESDSLQYSIPEQTATTEDQVTLHSARGTTRSQGLSADLKNGVYQLKAKVSGRYDPS